MALDKTAKLMLAMILVLLSLLVHREVVTPALAQTQPATAGGTAVTFLGPGGTMAYVVSDGKISFWEVDTVNGKPKLVMYDAQPLPK